MTNICCTRKNLTSFYLHHKKSEHLEKLRRFQHQLYKTGLPFFSFLKDTIHNFGGLAQRSISSSHCVDKVLLNRAGSPSETRLFRQIEEAEDNGR